MLSNAIYLQPFIRAAAYKRHNQSLASVVLPRGATDLRLDLPPAYRWRIRKGIYGHYRYLFEVETTLLENPSESMLDQCSVQIEEIERELSEVHVPLSYADQLYHLRMHLRFVKQRVDLARREG